MKKSWVFVVVAIVLGVAASAASAQPRSARGGLDQSFANGGILPVNPPLPPGWTGGYVKGLAAAADGSSFALLQRDDCGGPTCPSGRYALVRYAADGSFDPSFGGPGGPFEMPVEGFETPAVSVDSEGRPVIAVASNGRIVLRRVTTTGQADASFGAGGTAVLPCGRESSLTLLPGPAGTLNVVFGQFIRDSQSPFGGTVVTVERLGDNGSPLASFGEGGHLSVGLPGGGDVRGVALANQGGIYVATSGSGFSSLEGRPYLIRISAKGRLDGRFAAATERSLRSLGRILTTYSTPLIRAVVARADGEVDVLGYVSDYTGFDLRLKSNGRADARFGQKAIAQLPAPVNSAVRGSDGTTLAVSEQTTSVVAMRILPTGKLDPAFSRRGLEIPNTNQDGGVTVVRQSNRKAMVLDLGFQFCRQGCESSPKLIRLFEGARPKRR